MRARAAARERLVDQPASVARGQRLDRRRLEHTSVADRAATQQRFAAVQNEFRRFGMDIVAASVRRAQQQGYGTELNPQHTAAAIALLFENFTTVFVGASGLGGLGVAINDEDAIATLSRIWKKTLYGF